MAYKYGKKSLERLSECRSDIQEVMLEAIKYMDLSILCGHRGEEEQNKAYDSGNSKLKFPRSKHNKYPSLAVDVVPYPVDWDNIERFKMMGYLILGIAKSKGIELTWGGNWTSLKDYPHFEIKE